MGVLVLFFLYSFIALAFVAAAIFIKSKIVSVILVCVSGFLFNVSTLYGTTNHIKNEGVADYGKLSVGFGWPLKYVTQTHYNLPIRDSATIHFKMGGGVGSVHSKKNEYINLVFFIILTSGMVLVARTNRKKKRASSSGL